MRIIKKKANKTYKTSNGSEHHYINYFVELDNGKRVAIRTFKVEDLKVLDGVAVYEG